MDVEMGREVEVGREEVGREEHLVHMMADSLMSSDQILAHQSPTVRKFWRWSMVEGVG